MRTHTPGRVLSRSSTGLLHAINLPEVSHDPVKGVLQLVILPNIGAVVANIASDTWTERSKIKEAREKEIDEMMLSMRRTYNT